MTQAEMVQPRSGTFALFFSFLGGALVGGVTALLLAPRSGAETRRRIAGAVESSRATAARLPSALRRASGAAQSAFAAALKKSQGEDGIGADGHHS
jgi:gas vesicle protein